MVSHPHVSCSRASQKTCPLTKVDGLLADDIDQESECGEHREYHQKMKPTMPDGYVATAEDMRECPPMPVPPAPSAGQPASVRRSVHVSIHLDTTEV